MLSPSSSLLLLAKTITHPAARSLCDCWASCYLCHWRRFSLRLIDMLYFHNVRIQVQLLQAYLFFVVLMPCMVTFTSNIPVIFVTFRSHRFEEDSAAKVIASLAVSDIINGVMIICSAGMAWSLQPAAQRFRCGCWDYGRPVCTFSMFVPSLTWLPCLSSSVPLLLDLSPTLPASLTVPYVLYHLDSEHCSQLCN